MSPESSHRRSEQFALSPPEATRLAQAERALGHLDFISQTWPGWAVFASWPLAARAVVLETRQLGFDIELPVLLALNPELKPARPAKGLRWACGLMRARRKLAVDPSLPLLPSLVGEVFYQLDAPELARGYDASQTITVTDSLPGAPVWTLAPRLVEAGLPPLMAAGLVLATWQQQAPEHPHRDPAGWVLLSGLALRLGIPSHAVEVLFPALERAAAERPGGLINLLREMRKNGGWRAWLEVFLRAVHSNAASLTQLIIKVQSLALDHQDLINTWVRAPRHSQRFLNFLLGHPIVDLPVIARQLAITQRTAGHLAANLKDLGIIQEITGQRRGRRFAYMPLLDLLIPPPEV